MRDVLAHDNAGAFGLSRFTDERLDADAWLAAGGEAKKEEEEGDQAR